MTFFADRLRFLRDSRFMTQSELAEELGISKGAVGMWESGKREPDYYMLVKLATFFDVSTDYILGCSNDSTDPVLKEISEMFDPKWREDFSMEESLVKIAQLDDFGRNLVISVVNNEVDRCIKQKTLTSERNYKVNVFKRKKKVEEFGIFDE